MKVPHSREVLIGAFFCAIGIIANYSTNNKPEEPFVTEEPAPSLPIPNEDFRINIANYDELPFKTVQKFVDEILHLSKSKSDDIEAYINYKTPSPGLYVTAASNPELIHGNWIVPIVIHSDKVRIMLDFGDTPPKGVQQGHKFYVFGIISEISEVEHSDFGKIIEVRITNAIKVKR